MFRGEKLNNLVKEQLNKIIFKELDILPGILLTITRVECASNGKLAKVYVSVMPDEKFEEVFAFLKRHGKEIQYFLMKSLRIQPVPTIHFVEEKATKEAANIERLLGKIKKTAKDFQG
ncbi:MAG: 30S ribosome-binding factor RbfA [Candidatus Pacebacteria bacterium]|nr:30S ribosome-binding factor RbfA [Candidatus Paceibacterota bacterium]